MCWIEVCPTGKVECNHEAKGFDCWEDGNTIAVNREECYYRKRWFANVMLDTTYGAGGCLPCRHFDIAKKALELYGRSPAFSINNEMTGRVWSIPPGWIGWLPACDMRH